jgi:hypothetical protein
MAGRFLKVPTYQKIGEIHHIQIASTGVLFCSENGKKGRVAKPIAWPAQIPFSAG